MKSELDSTRFFPMSVRGFQTSNIKFYYGYSNVRPTFEYNTPVWNPWHIRVHNLPWTMKIVFFFPNTLKKKTNRFLVFLDWSEKQFFGIGFDNLPAKYLGYSGQFPAHWVMVVTHTLVHNHNQCSYMCILSTPLRYPQHTLWITIDKLPHNHSYSHHTRYPQHTTTATHI